MVTSSHLIINLTFDVVSLSLFLPQPKASKDNAPHKLKVPPAVLDNKDTEVKIDELTILTSLT